jgi:hypothetical protein
MKHYLTFHGPSSADAGGHDVDLPAWVTIAAKFATRMGDRGQSVARP